jgi:hypothetical protein
MVQLVCIRRACRYDRMLFYRCSRNSQGAVAATHLRAFGRLFIIGYFGRSACRAKHTSASTSTLQMVFQKYCGRKEWWHSREDLSLRSGVKEFGMECERRLASCCLHIFFILATQLLWYFPLFLQRSAIRGRQQRQHHSVEILVFAHSALVSNTLHLRWCHAGAGCLAASWPLLSTILSTLSCRVPGT